MELIVGGNGSGKSTIFEALGCIKEFVLNKKTVDETFPGRSLTRWQTREKIEFVLEILSEQEVYKYELSVKQGEFVSSFATEVLWKNDKKIIESQFFLEDPFAEEDDPFADSYLDVNIQLTNGPREFRVSDTQRSVLGFYAPQFKSALQNIFLVKMQPSAMFSSMKTSQRHPSRSFANFPAYYFHLLQEKQNLIFDLIPVLRENIEGFRSFVLEERGSEARQLRVDFAVEGGKKGQTIRYDFTELSDGQRALISLYTLAFCESGSTLLIDEPENFISSRELQPWLMLLRERIEDFGGQAILISHHPEFINVLAPQDAIQFRRKDGGPVMIRPFETAPYQGLTPAEIVARGWENE
jgi:AAA15 family ATPase/GTPase